MTLSEHLVHVFVIPLAIACVAWTVTHEEIFREPRDWCVKKSKTCRKLLQRKFFYLFTCEYCFSHYVTAFFVIITGYKLLYDGWQGYLIAGFAWVWVANIYMTLFGLLRQGLKKERIEASIKDIAYKEIKEERQQAFSEHKGLEKARDSILVSQH
jgi:hypothetical protein